MNIEVEDKGLQKVKVVENIGNNED